MMANKRRKRWSIVGAVVIVLVLAGLLGAAGCGAEGSESPGYGGAPSTTDGYYAQKSGADMGVALEEADSSAPEAHPASPAGDPVPAN